MTGPSDQGGGSANSGQGQGGQGGGVQTTMFTQDQVNHFNAEARRGALNSFFKDLGLDTVPDPKDLKGVLDKASEYDKLQDGQKNEVQRLTDQLSDSTKKAERVPALEAELERARIAADAGLKSKFWKFVEGKTEDEIKASVADIKKDIRGTDESDDQDEGQQQQQGAGGRPPAPNPQQGRGGGQPQSKNLQAGADAYRARHKKE